MSTRHRPPSNANGTVSPDRPASNIHSKTSSVNTSPTNMQQPSHISPFLPTLLEAALLSIYPITLVLGSLSSYISPHINNTLYSSSHQSFPPHVAPSYFARKKNIFNLYFVKVGWFWTTLALLLFILTHPSFGRPLSPSLTSRRIKATLRWLGATVVWVLVTQWCFGPPLIDRSFRLTGGMCEILDDQGQVGHMSTEREVLTHAACRVIGGQWKGGHDISGHVFLMILGSALLWMEVLPVVLRARGLREERRVLMADGRPVTTAVEKMEVEGAVVVEKEKEVFVSLGTKFAVGVVSLSWWMLLMTAAFFHTWFEKFTGLVVALAGIWIVYFIPRGMPMVRAVVGMPGL